jgi:methylmalonyl-CoA carboxyltransferase 5S subunit
MFPQVAAKFFDTREQGPKNLGKDPVAKTAPAPAAAAPPVPENGKGPVRTTITYDVKLNGTTHKVTVSPAA